MTQSTARNPRPPLPSSVRFADRATARFPDLAPTYFDAMWDGDPHADAFVADFATIGHGRAMKILRAACRDGISSVTDAPESLRALFAELDAVPDWVDLAEIDASAKHLGRYTRQAGVVLGAASLVSGYANSAASRPLELTGRYLDNAGARTIEVGSWLVESTTPGGLHRFAPGFELTVRVRIIHALVRHALSGDDRWDLQAWGVPISQAFMAYTLIEFCLIPLRGMSAIGAPYLPGEVAGYYARWRYIGHLLGIDAELLPRDREEQEALEEIYLLTRPEVDDYCRRLVGSINSEFLVPEIEQLLPHRRLYGVAPPVVHGLERVFLGDEIADELGVPNTRVKHLIRAVGPVLGSANRVIDRIPGTLGPRTGWGDRYRLKQDARLRARYSVHHDLVDAAPDGQAHPARGTAGEDS
ncbi:oxygenase MpaB family protein [Nocardioides houyundeii]|uniref:oxygenase MpaB family protein n=1 Tax=Nocardioides houyundeii TaxID=2045452 RepID=UPI000C786E1F|nr:oxygenase MpaB family protein [Nocardioides houyundeii]